MKQTDKTKLFKKGEVVMIGRPNVGKSTLLNAMLQQKVAIVSPRPQTTRSRIEAVYEDGRGQIFFVDTPGVYLGKGVSSFNNLALQTIEQAKAVIYVVDKTRKWGQEDERVLNALSQTDTPVVLVVNKIDVEGKDNRADYIDLTKGMVKQVVEVSALKDKNVKGVVDAVFELLPEGDRDERVDAISSPLLSQSGDQFVAELIREKIYLKTDQEVPYQTRVGDVEVEVDEETGRMRVVGEIVVASKRYKP